MYYFRNPNTTFPCYTGVELRQKENDSRITFLRRFRTSQSDCAVHARARALTVSCNEEFNMFVKHNTEMQGTLSEMCQNPAYNEYAHKLEKPEKSPEHF